MHPVENQCEQEHRIYLDLRNLFQLMFRKKFLPLLCRRGKCRTLQDFDMEAQIRDIF